MKPTMDLEKRARKLTTELLEAEISNVDPDDTATICARWHFLIMEAFKEIAHTR
jgi:hypothetical protein